MDGSAYWLIVLDEDRLEVALATRSPGRDVVAAAGPILAWESGNQEMFLAAVDQSLSAASANAGLTPETEPQQASFVLPAYWVGPDGKIQPHYSKLIEVLCKKFDFKPLGFISHDEAIVEEANLKDGFPSSFVLVHFDSTKITVSLAYLGKIKTRLQKALTTPFNPSLIETALFELKTDAALPPEIILTGAVNEAIYDAIAAYPWVGKKNIETFLHFPDVRLLTQSQVLEIYTRVISEELSPTPIPKKPLTTDSFYETEVEDESNETDLDEPDESETAITIPQEDQTPQTDDLLASPQEPLDSVATARIHDPLLEVDAQSLGFSLPEESPAAPLNNEEIEGSDSLTLPSVSAPLPVIDAAQIGFEIPLPTPKADKPKFSLPKFRLPLIRLPSVTATPLWLILALSPLLALIPFGLASAKITIFINPYRFDKNVNVTLDPSITDFSTAATTIPVDKKNFQVSVSSTRTTSGKKTIGDKAKGEIVIYNKLSKTQNLPAGTILSSDNKKFELTTAVSVASSSSNLDEGVITLGQTRAIVAASDIGPEYNLAKSTQLTFKDVPETSLVARVKEPFTGGSKRDINAVSETDRANLKTEAEGSLKSEIDKKIANELPQTPGILRDTVKISQNKIEFNREIGEEASELTATLTANISVMALKSDSTQKIISHFLQSEAGFTDSVIDPASFTLNFTINKADQNSAQGVLSITGSALPKLDAIQLKKNLTGKFPSGAVTLIKKTSSRIYNYKIENRLPYLGGLTPLPFSANRIDLEIRPN